MFEENYHMSRINQGTVGLKRQDLLPLRYVLRAAGGPIHIMSNKDQAECWSSIPAQESHEHANSHCEGKVKATSDFWTED